jgi:hypothetical protein
MVVSRIFVVAPRSFVLTLCVRRDSENCDERVRLARLVGRRFARDQSAVRVVPHFRRTMFRAASSAGRMRDASPSHEMEMARCEPRPGDVVESHVMIEGAARIAERGERTEQYAREHRPDAVGHAWADRSDFKVFLDAR